MRSAPILAALALILPSAAVAGTIKGVVTFKGEAPARPTLRRDSDPYCNKTQALAEDVIVTDGKVRDVVVRVKNGTGGTHAAPKDPVVLTQSGCRYGPHVATAIAGQPLAVKNADATYHNVHGWLAGKTLWNDSHPAAAADLVRPDVGKAGDVVELKCDVHPWMHAYVVVTDHPYVAVTGDDGAFELTGLAPGKYVVEAWHPVLGLRTTKVTIGKKGKKATAKASFVFTPVKPDDDE